MWTSPDTHDDLVTWSIGFAWELADSQAHHRPIGSDSQRVRPSNFFQLIY